MSKSLPYAGQIHIYSAPAALTQHIEWAINQVLSQVGKFNWQSQPLSAGAFALEFEYKHHKDIGAKIATTLKGWHYIRFELYEVNKNTQDATLYRVTPELGLHQASLASNGDVVLNENQLTHILKTSISHEKLISNLENALGSNWESELEPYRIALATGLTGKLSKSG